MYSSESHWIGHTRYENMTTKPKAKVQAIESDDAVAELLRVLADNLRIERASRRMTQRDLSKATGISQKYISAIELVTANPAIAVLASLVRGFPGLTAADLLTPRSKNRTP